MIDFLILYEYKARELENICLLKAELEHRGYSVVIVNRFELKKIKYFIMKPKVIVVPFLYDNEDLKYHVYARFGRCNKIVNLQWEQIHSKRWEEIGFHIPRDNAKFATHICWGNECRTRLKDAGVKNAIITGPIHMDFLREEFKNYYKTRNQLNRKFNLDKNKKLVLYISSFSFTTMAKEEIQGIEKRISAKVNDLQKAMVESKKETLKWFEKMLLENEDLIVIYRPHPDEKSDITIERLSKKYRNFVIIDKYSVKQWILVSDTVFTWFSTSIVESFFAKKNCYMVRPCELNQDWDAVININADFITSYDEMMKAIYEGNFNFPIKEEILMNHYNVGEIPSYIRTCNLLEKIAKEKKYNMPKSTFQGNSLTYLFGIIIDEFISMLYFLDKRYNIPFLNKYNSFKKYKSDLKHYGKEIASKKEVNSVLNAIKKIIL